MRHLIIGTAGHVDHGKTALIRALTGVETDRLPEEQARGMSIELGFAYFDLPNGTRCGVVDVPGHERFIDAMVSGAYGMDVVLFVVSAKEGAKRQTVEHLQILDLLGVHHGILVVTMRDLVSDEELDFAVEETMELLEGTSLAGVPHVAVSSTTGAGIENLRTLLSDVASRVQNEEPPDAIPRLPIDRVFTVEGFGLVVTGTLRDGSLEAEQRVIVLPRGRTARIRTIQVHGQTVARAFAGQRTALNLVGVEKEALGRGDVLTLPEFAGPSANLDVSLRIVDDFPRIVEHGTRVRLHIGTDEVFCRLTTLVDREGLLPGASSAVQLRLEEPVAAVRGDRFILRDASAQRTVGGGVVLDPQPRRHRRLSDATRRAVENLFGDNAALLTHLLERDANPFVPASSLTLYFPYRRRELDRFLADAESDGRLRRAGEAVIAPSRLSRLVEGVESELRRFHAAEPLAPGEGVGEVRAALETPMSDDDFAWLASEMSREGRIARDGNLLRLASHSVEFGDEDEAIRVRAEEAIRAGGVASPSLAELAEGLSPVPPARIARVLQTLAHVGSLVRVGDDYWVHRDVYAETLERLRSHLRANGSLDIAGFRDLTGASRKYAVPFLEHCDARGYTVRVGNVRRARPAFLASGT
jgi:selenocysteine-specific elongation factor